MLGGHSDVFSRPHRLRWRREFVLSWVSIPLHHGKSSSAGRRQEDAWRYQEQGDGTGETYRLRIDSFYMRSIGNMLPKKGKKLHRRSRGDGPEVDFCRRISGALRTELGSTHQAVKTVMRWTGASERSVKYWFAGTHGPRGWYLVALARHSDGVLRVFLAMAERSPVVVAMRLVELRAMLRETLEHVDGQLVGY